MTLSKEQVFEIFTRVGMTERVISVNYTKFFEKKTEVEVEEIVVRYKKSKSKYKEAVLEILDTEFEGNSSNIKVEYSQKEDKMIDMIFAYADLKAKGCDKEVLTVILKHEKKSEKQIALFTKKALDQNGDIKPKSKYYHIAKFVRNN